MYFPFSFLIMSWKDHDTFEFWMPAQAISKSTKKESKEDPHGRRWIQGIASTSSRDLQGEVVEQNGIDFSYFLKYGYFNWDHKPGEDNRVGEPTEATITKNGLWVKGYLYPKGVKKTADDIWEHMHATAAAGGRRKMGFSIQGKVQRREGTTIKKCWIQEIAVTSCPVNTTTWAEIAKSLSAQTWDLEKDEAEKAVIAENPLVPESLESTVKDTVTSKSLTFDEAIAYITTTTGMDISAAEATARVVFSQLCKE